MLTVLYAHSKSAVISILLFVCWVTNQQMPANNNVQQECKDVLSSPVKMVKC